MAEKSGIEGRRLQEEFLTESVKESFGATEEGGISMEIALSFSREGRSSA